MLSVSRKPEGRMVHTRLAIATATTVAGPRRSRPLVCPLFSAIQMSSIASGRTEGHLEGKQGRHEALRTNVGGPSIVWDARGDD